MVVEVATDMDQVAMDKVVTKDQDHSQSKADGQMRGQADIVVMVEADVTIIEEILIIEVRTEIKVPPTAGIKVPLNKFNFQGVADMDDGNESYI